MKEANEMRIIFFDGVCGLCNSSVNFILKRKKVYKFKFAALQGRTANSVLPEKPQEPFNSVIYSRKGILKYRSDAALWILVDLGGLWSICAVFLIFPKFIRNGVYDWIGRNRYRWFGKSDTCRIPTAEETSYFLD